MALLSHAHSRRFTNFLLGFAFASLVTAGCNSAAQAPAAAVSPATAHASYGALPLSFEANRGQADPRALFVSRGNQSTVVLARNGEMLVRQNPLTCAKDSGKGETCWQQTPETLSLTLAGPARRAKSRGAFGEDELPGKVNYFLGNDQSKWLNNLPTYAKVRYPSVYPGIDLVYYGNQRQLEFDLAVAPGADPSAIRLRFTGQQRLTIAATGDLILAGRSSDAVFHRPVVYQERNGQREPVSGSFYMAADGAVGFRLGRYDRARRLVIDPVLSYSTYLGGSGSGSNGDQGNGIAVDSAGSAYIVGTTYSANFPVTDQAFQSANSAQLAGHGSNVFVSKLNAAGTALVYSTYLGGTGSSSGGDFGYGIALDSAGDAYITGATNSADFPVTCTAFQAVNPSATTGATTGFVAKLNSTGNALEYSTYLGGSGSQSSPAHGDVSQAIAVDSSGSAYLTGYTWSENFPTTNGAYQADNKGVSASSNAFVTKLNATGTALVYSTFLGGAGSSGVGDYGNSIALDPSGDAFIAGSTASANFPVTSGAIQSTLLGAANAFVTELNPTGTVAVYSTYLGGSGADTAQAIAVDSTGAAYLAGNTNSGDFPLTSGVIEGADSGIGTYIGQGSGAFAAKINKTGSALAYSTYLEGIGPSTNGSFISVTGIAVDSAGDAIVAGSSPVIGVGAFGAFQTTADALPTPTTSANAAFLVKLDPAAATLKYATLLGGSSNNGDAANALALDSAGNAYLTGAAYSTDFPTTAGAYQTANHAPGTASNAFIAKLALASESTSATYPALPTSISTSLIASASVNVDCPDNEITFSVFATIVPASYGPPPTGQVEADPNGFGSGSPYPLSGSSWGGGSFGGQYQTIDPPYGDGPFTYSWDVSYFGDSLYQASYFGGNGSFAGCPEPDSATPAKSQKFKVHTQFIPMAAPSQAATAAASANGTPALGAPFHANPSPRARVAGPKFVPESVVADRLPSASVAAAQPREAPACVEVKPSLTVTLQPASASRLYGAANPNFTYAVSGLLNGDTVTVAPSTTATPASPVGAYKVTAVVGGAAAAHYNLYVVESEITVLPAPLTVTLHNNWRLYGEPNPAFQATIYGLVGSDTVTVDPQTAATQASPAGNYAVTADVTGPATANYTVTVHSATLLVDRAPLHISAGSVATTYGHAPTQPTAYMLTGFVNGDTAATAVTGAPVLSTTVTATTPVGFYPIGVAVGTLSAANYAFETTASGEGAVAVDKAPLKVLPASFTIHAGDPLPTFTYVLMGFINGDTAAAAVSGAPALTTTAPNNTTPGRYYIIANVGSLTAHNYAFDQPTPVTNGILTILPN